MSKNMKASLLVYDIPSALDYPNPSYLLRRCAFRVNLSAWVVTDESTPWNLLEEFTEQKIDWKLFPFADSANESLIRTCQEAICKEIAESQERNRESLETAQRKHREELEAATTDRERELADRKYGYAIKALNKRANQLLDDLTAASKVFGLDPENLPIRSAFQTVNALQATAQTKAHLYAQMTEQVQNTPLSVAANEGSVPAVILADYVEETTGQDQTAVREAFQETETVQDNRQVVSNTIAPVQVPREFSVSTRNGIRRVTSSMTNREAANVCLYLTNNSFAQDLARRINHGNILSANQLAWLHVLAVEAEQTEKDRQEKERNMMAKVEAIAIANGCGKTNAAVLDDEIPGEATEIDSSKSICSASKKTLTVEDSDLGLSYISRTIKVKSHKTGSVKTFTHREEEWQNGELIANIYTSADGWTLRILND